MNKIITPGEADASLISNFFQKYEIRALTVKEAVSLTGKIISEVNILFINDAKENSRDYSVKFKLLDECVDIHQYLSKINAESEISIEIRNQGKELPEEEFTALIKTFFKTITSRVQKIRKEESVQSITYVGNTFTLYGTTTFKVLTDDGEGNLTIEILNKNKEAQNANMSSHSLLDGLYLGSIQLVES